MSEAVSYENHGPIAILSINNPPVNALGLAVRQGLKAGIERAESDNHALVVLIIASGRTFPAGADIREFGKPPVNPSLPDVVRRIEACSKPVIAALHGTALGGGFEVALAAHYRIADKTARIGLPEVNLGILPGAGGTQRTTRIAGAKATLDLATGGKPIGADKAKALGLIDVISGDDLKDAAIAYAHELIASNAAPRPSGARSEGLLNAAENTKAINDTAGIIAKRARGQFAPFRIVECVDAALTLPIEDGLAFEREQFLKCMETPQRQGMIHAFFAERSCTKTPEASRAAPRPLNQIAVIGGGTMGAGITVAALNAGLPVVMVERDTESIARGQANVEKVYDAMVKKGRMDAATKAKRMALYTPATDYAAMSDSDLIIEAVFENIEVKQDVFRQLDQTAKPGAVLATNTSYLDVDAIANVTSRPQDVIGLHFFSPANIMKLLEIVVPSNPADDAVATGFALAKKLKKTPVRAANHDGFIGNRIYKAYGLCATYMMEDGASPYAIDKAIYDFGYPIGIFQVHDLAGMDISWANRKRLAANRNPAERYSAVQDKLCEAGHFGQKTGRGMYVYPEGMRMGEENPDVLQVISEEQARLGISPRDFTADDIMRRYMAAMVNEGAKVLQEGVALRPSDIDVVALYGYGFPRYRGGPMKYADMYGLDNLLADLREFEAEDAHFWKPAQLLVDLVANGRSFEDLNKDS
ncbi:3-hydroxyacyl-CoA dehydrogenase NAD-binding domain-containing protein [Halocynthiibacter namhaensis]|uniref:3-hydroxyacyl-CoA dehydrogenase NAD-binding domain-containing protein n=1 Tax=Halocynthiibacter namhaensis TaxID=1290553 RepID=UPI00057906B4|nr:3-hydroxyacyl-CoA dehydrogenase NAD-binding domain-containing protein [Halocynthiibacter namhaensis]